MVKCTGGGIDSGIPSNIGVIKAHYEEKEFAISKGETAFNLDSNFKPSKVVGVVVIYGTYIGGQPMMAMNGVYESSYGLSFRIEQMESKSTRLVISASGTYGSRPLKVIVFYI